jgi:hypothetical protein
LIERVILSAGAMLIFSVSFQILKFVSWGNHFKEHGSKLTTKCPKAKEKELILLFIYTCICITRPALHPICNTTKLIYISTNRFLRLLQFPTVRNKVRKSRRMSRARYFTPSFKLRRFDRPNNPRTPSRCRFTGPSLCARAQLPQ